MSIREFQPSRAVEIIVIRDNSKNRDNSKKDYGSGYRIGGKLVLTAAHLLDGVGSYCVVRNKRSFGENKAQVIWKAQGLDIALIELSEKLEEIEPIVLGKLPESKRGEKIEFLMYGYPAWARTQRNYGKSAAGGRQVEGIIYLSDTSPDGLLVLEPLRSPEKKLDNGSDWEGSSGAAIICDGLIVAVQKQHQNPERPSSLEAVPLWLVYDDEQWRNLLKKHGISCEPKIACLKSSSSQSRGQEATTPSEYQISQAKAGKFISRFFNLEGSRPEKGINLTGYLRESISASVRFNFWITTGQELTVRNSTLEKWCHLAESESVIIFHIEIISQNLARYRFLEISFWMVKHPEWISINRSETTIISIDELNLIDIDDLAINFSDAVKWEANRVLKRKSTLRVRQSYHVPTNFVDFFYHLGNLESLEVPENVLRETIKNHYDEQSVVLFLRNLALSSDNYRQYILRNPATKKWISQVRKPYSVNSANRERRQFRIFIDSMIRYYQGDLFDMPRFKSEDLACWRIFFQLFPESFPLLERVLKYPQHWDHDQVMACFLLSSTLANSHDYILSSKANNLLLMMEKNLNAVRVYSRDQHYQVLRQFYFTRAETGNSKDDVDRCLNFIYRSPLELDLRLNKIYYGDPTNKTLERALRRKLETPKSRDIQTARISEMMLERFT